MVEAYFGGLSSELEKTCSNAELYQQIIGLLLYLSPRTRHDISAPLLIIDRFQKQPTTYCDRAAKRVKRYLKGTIYFELSNKKGSTVYNDFVDVDYACDTIDRKSMSGYTVKLGN